MQVDESEEDKSLQEVKQDALDDLNQSAVEDYVSLVKGLRDDDLPDDKIIATEKENVKKQLKDAKSARFKDLKLVTHKGAKFLCGKVNAKNSFGGYAGYTDFVSYSLVRFSNNRNGKVIVDGICFN